MSIPQTQQVLPVTYGSNTGVYNHNLTSEIHHVGEHISRDIQNSERGVVREINNGTTSIKSDLSADTANIIAQINAQQNANASNIRASEIESRQAIERNADNITNNVLHASTQGLLATKNTSTQALLAVHNTSTQELLATQSTALATQLTIQNNSGHILNAIGTSSSQVERIAGEYRDITYNQTHTLSAHTRELQITHLEETAALALQASESKAALQLQAAEYKGYLVNHITKTAADEILKTSETNARVLEKLIECCCESLGRHSVTRDTVVQNSTNVQNSVQNGDNNRLQQALVAAQQEALLTRLRPT